MRNPIVNYEGRPQYPGLSSAPANSTNWDLDPPPATNDPSKPKKVGSMTSNNSGLMGAAGPKTQFAPSSMQAATYNPTGYKTKKATATGYDAATGTASTYDPSSMDAASYDASTYDPTNVDRAGTTYDPTLQDVQGNQLVSDQLTGLVANNGKYIQQARQQAREAAAGRGLMTSSIAAGNAQRAAIQSALPIAQADAARYGSVADQNMAASNMAGKFNAGQNLQASMADAAAANQAGQFNAGAENQAGQFNASNEQAANQYNATAENQAGQFNANSQNQMTQANMAATNRAGEFTANADNQASQFNANSANQAAYYNANSANEAGQFNVGQLNAAAQFNTAQDNSTRLTQQQQAEKQYEFNRNLGAQQANQYFGSQFQREQMMGKILSSIYSNPNLTPQQQQQAANNAKAIYQGLWNATNATFAQGVPNVFTNV